MKIYCVSCKKNTTNENSSVTRTKQNRIMLVSNCVTRKNQGSFKIKKQVD